MNYNIRTIFPTTLCECDLTEDVTPLEELVKDKCGERYMSEDCRILNELPEWKDLILQPFRKFVKNTLRTNIDVALASSWGTCTHKSTTHLQGGKLHFHSNSWYSGVLHFDDYVNDSEGGMLNFMDMSLKNFDFDYYKSNQYNSRQYCYKPKRGRVVFFPSSLYHQIVLPATDKTRYSLAFNILPTGQYGDADSGMTVEVLH